MVSYAKKFLRGKIGAYGATSTSSNNAVIVSDGTSNYLEVYGANDTIIGGDGNDTIGAVVYSSAGINGNNAYINGGAGNDVLIATAIQGEQYATLGGALGIDTFAIGCNSDATINAVFADINPGWENVAVFYEDYHEGCFTCYSTDKGLIFKDDAGRLNVTVNSIFQYDELNGGKIYFYPHGYRGGNVGSVSWQETAIIGFVNYGGYISGLTISDNTISVNDYHAGNVDLRGSGFENLIVIDNTPSTDARILVGNNQWNYIYAGSSGDTLWGGAGNDFLTGGNGNDNFLYGAGEGVDLITNSNWLDTVTLHNLTLNDFGVYADSEKVILACDANNSVTIQYNAIYSPMIKLADGSQYRYNGQSGSWQNY